MDEREMGWPDRADFEASPQCSLGALIDGLATADPTSPVFFDFCSCAPTNPESFRGYYDELALGWTAAHDDARRATSVALLLDRLRAADGRTFTGYKGGDYRMDRQTPVWVANHGQTGGTAIVGVEDAGWAVILRTAWLDD